MAPDVGSRLGHYDVTALIGEGGMGQVYRATDTKLNRQVALKILPEAFAQDPDRLARFQREAQVLASLNHPGIAAIHGIEESDGQRALVLELVEGPTLADRIAKGPIPLDEALPIAKQIAEALEAAHEAGVIHRDLKPANIKVREDGTVKVLDFGLAKAMQPDASDSALSQSPTISLTAAATQMGMVIGTAAYMAPEQAKGLPVDKRADIWAFGAVLFEMLTGRKLFEADDVSEMLASVLVKTPDISGMGADVPAHIRSVVRRCLVKDPKQRLRDIGDVRLAIDGEFETAASEPKGASRLLWQRPVPLVLAMTAVALLTGLGVWSLTRLGTVAPPPPMRFDLTSATQALVVGTPASELAISPDGLEVAYLSGADFIDSVLVIRSLSELNGQTLEATASVGAVGPFFSPDGEWVGFYDFVSRALQRVSVLGGPAIPIGELPEEGLFRGASWDTNDTIVFGTSTPSGLWRVPVAGGEPESLTKAEGIENHIWPTILPGGRAVVFTIWTTDHGDARIAVLDLDTGRHKILVASGHAAHYVRSGHLVYGSGGALLAVGFDRERLEVTTNPVPVMDNVSTKLSGDLTIAVSDAGSLVYVTGDTPSGALTALVGQGTLVWVDRDGAFESLPLEGAFAMPRLSPDGRRLAITDFDDTRGGTIWIHDLQRGGRELLIVEDGDHRWPVWTDDGTHIVYTSSRPGEPGLQLFRKPIGVSGPAVPLEKFDDQAAIPISWSNRTKTLGFYAGPGDGSTADILVLSEDDSATPVLTGPFAKRAPSLSPDGRWLAYVSDESGRNEVYLRPYPARDPRRPVSTSGGTEPVWSRDGRELFFRNGTGMFAVRIDTAEDPPRLGSPELLFEGPFSRDPMVDVNPNYDVAEDGRFLMVLPQRDEVGAAPAQMHIVLNWHQELLERVPLD